MKYECQFEVRYVACENPQQWRASARKLLELLEQLPVESEEAQAAEEVSLPALELA